MKGLQATIFFFFVALLLAVQAVFLQTIYRATQQQEIIQVENRLGTPRTVFRSQFESRRYFLGAFAETAAKDFGLKQVFQEDTRSFLVALNNHRQRIDADMAMAITPDGRISAQVIKQIDSSGADRIRVGPEQGQLFQFPDWLELPDDTRLYPLQNAFYQLSMAPLKSGSQVIGWIGFGYNIDQRLAAYFADLTGLTTDFALATDDGWLLLASSRNHPEEDHRRQENARISRIMNHDQGADVIATTESLGTVGSRHLAAVMYGDRADLLAAIRKRWWELGLLAALTLSLSMAGAYLIAARISRPVQVLVRQAKRIARGNYDLSVNIDCKGELRELVDEFEQMQQAVVSREQLISHQAYHDELTDLPNRHRLIQVLEQWVEDHHRAFSLCKLAVRRINDINSSLGHEIGDQVIREVGRRLRGMAVSDQLFHLGGSEFVLMTRPENPEQTGRYMELLLPLMEPEWRYQGISLYIEVQTGMALFPAHDLTASGLLQKAAIALQHAQKTGASCQLYDGALGRDSIERLQLINQLKTAICQDQLILHYQPKLDLATGRVRHVEALVRWQHPTQGMVPPDKFIAVAEQTGLINALTRWVLVEAVRQHRLWKKQGLTLSISVNISAENLRDHNFYDMVAETLLDDTLDRDAISLEITESAVVDDPEAAISVLNRIESEGIRLSIDDYGTGYSSLAQLKQLPVSELKMDKSFVQKLLVDRDDQTIVHSTIDLAHNMGLRVVAEGVEDAESLAWLRRKGCDLGQGYFICRPKPADELGEWLMQSDYLELAKVCSL